MARLGLAAYSFRDHFSFFEDQVRQQRRDGAAMNMVDFLDYCAKQWIRDAQALGAGHIRFFAGTEREVQQVPRRIEEAIEAIQECAQVPAEQGFFWGSKTMEISPHTRC